MIIRLKLLVLMLCTMVSLNSPLWAEQTLEDLLVNAPRIHRVEEDWELKVSSPDPQYHIPQIVTVFGPTNAHFDTHAVFELNHGTMPSFAQGGMQLQVWYGSWLTGYQSRLSPTQLATPNEIIKYTTSTAISGEYLVLRVHQGQSATFGNFGGEGTLRIRMFTLRRDLNPYEPGNSLRHSRVTFGANRVSYFRRNAIRVYDDQGNLFAQDNTPRYVHQLTEE